MDAKPSETRDLVAVARERVRIGSAPDWIVPCSYDADFKEKVRGPVTHLLIEQQVHAELRQTFVRMATRLETLQAVQNRSQWRLEFEPQTQSVILHSIKVRRGSSETEHASLDRIQFLQRESGLEGYTIDGWITLLLLLEDVLPGDVLEWSYSVESQPRLLPEYVFLFFGLPPGVQVGKHHFSVRHAERRVLKWKSSSPELAPTIQPEAKDVRCFWQSEKFSSPELEECTPGWQIVYPWIQVSDCPDWQTVARGVAEAWKEEIAGDGLTKLAEEVKSVGPDLLVRINRAIELVQDGFRYLSVNLELGGHVPASAETVIRRRYGDCKDKAFLLVRLLRGLGISARPVWVNAMWRQSVSSMLPSPMIFNHAVVEYEVENEKRWVDATIKCQGGGALNRCVADFGLGLPIDSTASELVPVPKASLPSGAYEVMESFLLDTAGSFSYLAIVVTAKGVYADSLRFELESDGAEHFAKKRLQRCANRFSRAGRLGQLEHRDDREHNEFVLAEVFEIVGFLKEEGDLGTCAFFIQSDSTAGLLRPSINPRRNPFALPFPCNLVHTVEIDFTGLHAVAAPVFQASNEFFNFSRRSKALRNFFRVTFSFRTLADLVPADKLQEHRKQVESVWQASLLQLRLPLGYSRMRKRSDFGALPRSTRTASSSGPSLVQKAPAALATASPGQVEEARTNTPFEKASPSKEAKVAVEQRVFIDPSVPAATDAGLLKPWRQKSSRRYHASRRPRMNKKCAYSFSILLGVVLGFVIGGVLSRTPGAGGIAAVLVVISMLAMVWSLVLAILGLTECVKHSERHPRGKSVAILTLVCLFGLILIPVIGSGVRGATNASKARSRLQQGSAELLRFDELSFVFHSPGLPWNQIDARRFGRVPVLAFARTEPMFFTVCANRLEPGFSDARARLVELCKANTRRDTISYQLVKEGEVTRNGLAGWETETKAAFQGHEYYLVHWVLATNGFGYQLVIWGSPALSSQVKEEAERLFLNFELTARKD